MPSTTGSIIRSTTLQAATTPTTPNGRCLVLLPRVQCCRPHLSPGPRPVFRCDFDWEEMGKVHNCLILVRSAVDRLRLCFHLIELKLAGSGNNGTDCHPQQWQRPWPSPWPSRSHHAVLLGNDEAESPYCTRSASNCRISLAFEMRWLCGRGASGFESGVKSFFMIHSL